MLFTIGHKVIFWQQSTVASIWNNLHYDCCNTKILKKQKKKKSSLAMSNWWSSFLPSTRTFLFQLFMTHHKTKREIDKSLLPSKNNVLWFGTCVRVEELIFLAFLMKSLHQPVSNKTQWNSGDSGHGLWISYCTSVLLFTESLRREPSMCVIV